MNHMTTDTDATEVTNHQDSSAKEQLPKIQPKYRISDITPMDMFPHTHHIETVVRLERI